MSITQDDFKKIWASTSSVPEYTFSDNDYQNGWEFVGNLPPTRAMWDTLQRRNDQKMKFLQDNGSMCFDSVADMVASNLESGHTVITKGYYSVNDGGSALYTIRAKDVADVEDGGSIIFLDNGNVAELITDGTVNVKQFGAKGDGIADDTQALLNVKAFVADHLPITVYVPVGTYNYTDIGNWAFTGLTIQGESMTGSVLHCVGTPTNETALMLWAFESGSPTAPFIEYCNLKNISVRGNSTIKYIVRSYGIVRSHWSNVLLYECSGENGSHGLRISINVANIFEHVVCSYALTPNAQLPKIGVYVENGQRAGADLGRSTNLVFINPIMEGVGTGIYYSQADQCTVIGGTSEANDIGVLIANLCRHNTFVGHAMEVNSTYDFVDNGEQTYLLNSYTRKILSMHGKRGTVQGGLHETIDVIGEKNTVCDCIVNYSGTGGYTDTGVDNVYRNLYDNTQQKYIYPIKARQGITVGASPFLFTNDTGRYIDVVIQNGTISSIVLKRNGGDPVAIGQNVPTKILLAPTDELTVTYTGTSPSMSYIPTNIW